MGASGRQPQQRRRPSADEAFRVFKKRRDSLGFDWVQVNAPLLVAALDAATKNGAAVMIGGVQDGRGVSVTVFRDGGKDKDYASLPEELDELCHLLINVLASSSEDLYQIHKLPSPVGGEEE